MMSICPTCPRQKCPHLHPADASFCGHFQNIQNGGQGRGKGIDQNSRLFLFYRAFYLSFHYYELKSTLRTGSNHSCASFNVIFPVASVSLPGERVAGEVGCNSGYCFGASESFVSKISVFSNMMFCWFMSWSGSFQVYNRFRALIPFPFPFERLPRRLRV